MQRQKTFEACVKTDGEHMISQASDRSLLLGRITVFLVEDSPHYPSR